MSNIRLLISKEKNEWKSLSYIREEQIRFFRKNFSAILDSEFTKTSNYNFKKDEVWVAPIGSVNKKLFKWLETIKRKNIKRPPILFYWNSEGAKMGYRIWKYISLFQSNDQWVVNCESEKKILNYLYPYNKRTHVIHLPINEDLFSKPKNKDKKKIRNRLGLPEKSPLLLYSGRISEQKNVEIILDLMKNETHWKLILCGDIDDISFPHLSSKLKKESAFKKRIIKKIEKLKIQKKVYYYKHQEQRELSHIMLACDAQVSFSNHYGEDFGYSIAQGLGAGLKTLVSSWGGHNNWKSKFPGTVSYNRNIVRKTKDILNIAKSRNNKKIKINENLNFFWIKKIYNSKRMDNELFKNEKDEFYRYIVKCYQK